MGLDMYLRSRQYLSGYDFSKDKDKEKYQKIVEALGAGALADPETPSVVVELTVAYWRKANAIHQWFVKHVQGEKDDCGNYEVSMAQLRQLYDTCKEVLRLANVSDGQPVHSGTTYRAGQPPEEHFVEGRAVLNQQEIAAILPTQGGFFFGSTDYDEWYLRDVEDTIKQLDRIFQNAPENAWFEYHASW